MGDDDEKKDAAAAAAAAPEGGGEGASQNRRWYVVRVQSGAISVADGPLAEIREHLAGIFTIDARDLNEAIQVAATMPQARTGPIEVRSAPAFEHPWAGSSGDAALGQL